MNTIEFYDTVDDYDKATAATKYTCPDVTYEFLHPMLGPEHKRLLDVGIGTGLSSAKLAADGLRVVGVDGSRKLLDVCAEKGFAEKLVLADLSSGLLPELDGKFDVVVSIGVLEFIYDVPKLFAQVYEGLNAGGLFAICVRSRDVNPDMALIEVDGQKNVVEGLYRRMGFKAVHYETAQIIQWLEQSGLTVEQQHVFDAYVSPTSHTQVKNVLMIARRA